MGHIIQTKQASRASGGPQYYLHSLEPQTKAFLAKVGACPVWLGTPYGIVTTGLMAVSRDKVPHVGEEDILRVSGALNKLGIQLDAYRKKGYDCFE